MNGRVAKILRRYALSAYSDGERHNEPRIIPTYSGKKVTGTRTIIVGPRAFYQFAKKLYLKIPRPMRDVALRSAISGVRPDLRPASVSPLGQQ